MTNNNEKKNYPRQVIGSFMKSKDLTEEEAKQGKIKKPPYIKFNVDYVAKKGDILRLENKQYQLDSLNAAVTNGKLKAESAEKQRERIEKIPDFVIAEVVLLNY